VDFPYDCTVLDTLEELENSSTLYQTSILTVGVVVTDDTLEDSIYKSNLSTFLSGGIYLSTYGSVVKRDIDLLYLDVVKLAVLYYRTRTVNKLNLSLKYP
jgi:hypothetical protein